MNTQPLLGREDVLARADALLADCRSGHGGVLWIHGDAGIGKTRVLAEVAARADGCTVLRGTGWETPARRRSGSGPRSCGPRPSYVLPSGGAIAVGWRCRCSTGSGEAQVDVPGRFPLFDAVDGVVDDLADERPVVLLLDDVHWVDVGSLRLLQFLTTDLSERAVLVVCSWRDHDADVTSEQRDLAAQVAARGESWLLRGLPADDVRTLISATTGRDPGEDETRAVTERTGGNPLFVSEMARLAASRGRGLGRDRAARVGPGHHPSSRRPTRPAGRGRARRRGGAGCVVVDDPAGLAARYAARRAGRAGRRAGRRRAGDAGGDRLDFSHALVRDAVYEALAPARRRELHLAAAELVDAEYARTGAQAAERAHHLIQALPLVSADTVAAAAQDASRAAAAMLAYEDSVRWCDRALELVDPGSPRHSDLLLLAGETRLSAGDLDRAREAFLAAADLGRRTDDADLFARAALGFASGLSRLRGAALGPRADRPARGGAGPSRCRRLGAEVARAGPGVGRAVLLRLRRATSRARRGGRRDGTAARRPEGAGRCARRALRHDRRSGVRRPARGAGERDRPARPTSPRRRSRAARAAVAGHRAARARRPRRGPARHRRVRAARRAAAPAVLLLVRRALARARGPSRRRPRHAGCLRRRGRPPGGARAAAATRPCSAPCRASGR